jgi:hypothetical protein
MTNEILRMVFLDVLAKHGKERDADMTIIGAFGEGIGWIEGGMS